jgi:hypothetical protein
VTYAAVADAVFRSPGGDGEAPSPRVAAWGPPPGAMMVAVGTMSVVRRMADRAEWMTLALASELVPATTGRG